MRPQGITVLVSTHYMDEAERCHEIAYIAYGELMARGTAEEIIRASGLIAFVAAGPGADRLAAKLRDAPGVTAAAAFGATLACLRSRSGGAARGHRAVRTDPSIKWQEAEPTLEDVFIHLMGKARDNAEVLIAERRAAWWLTGFWRRLGAIVAKEVRQLGRDRLTFAMMFGLPIMQLLLFGYAIDTDPHRLPTAVLVADQSQITRTILSALSNTGYMRFTHRPKSEAEANALLQSGEVQFVVTIPSDFTRRLVRGERAQILIDADATDPMAAANPLAAAQPAIEQALARDLVGPLAGLRSKPGLGRGRAAAPLQSRGQVAAERGARPAGGDPHPDHGDDDRACRDPRA